MYLVDNLGIGGRLNYVELHHNLGTLDPSGTLHAYRLAVPASRALAGEMGFVVAHTSGAIAGIAGESEQGQPWITVLQFWQAQDAGAAAAALHRALERVGGFEVVARVEVSVAEVRDYYDEAIVELLDDPDAAEAISSAANLADVTYALHGLAVEITGYPIALAAQYQALGCAFPNVDHLCQGDVHSDVMTAWVEQRLPEMLRK